VKTNTHAEMVSVRFILYPQSATLILLHEIK